MSYTHIKPSNQNELSILLRTKTKKKEIARLLKMGNNLADEWLTAGAGKPEAVRRVIVRLGCAVGGADGNFDAGEVGVVAHSAVLLNINPSSIPPLVAAAEATGVRL